MTNWFLMNSSFSILLQFDLMLSEDGSGRGAALVAAVAVRRVRTLSMSSSVSIED